MGLSASEGLPLDIPVTTCGRAVGLRAWLVIVSMTFCLPMAWAQETPANNNADPIDELVLLLQTQLSETRDQNTDLRRRLDSLATELEASRSAYEEMAAGVVERDARIAALEAAARTAREAPPAVAPDALVAAEREARELAVTVADLAETRRMLEDQQTLLEGRLQDMRRDVQRLTEERDEAQSEVEGARSVADEHERLQGRVRDLERDLDRLTAEREAAHAEIEKLRDPGAGPAARIAELDAAVGELRAVEARQALAGMEDRLAEVTAARDAMAANLASKSSELAASADEHAALEERIRRLTGTDEQRRRAMDELLARLAGVEEDLGQATARGDVLRRERDAERDAAAALREELDREGTGREQAVARLDQELKAAVEARDELAGRIGRHEVETRRLTAQIEELDDEVARLRALDSQRRQTMDNLMLELAEAKNQARDLAAELETARAAPAPQAADPAEIEALQARIHDLERANRDLHQAIEQAASETDGDAEPDVLRERIAAAGQEAERLRGERDAMSRQIDALETELVQVRADIAEAPEAQAAVREQWERERAELNAQVKQLSVQREADEEALAEFRSTVDELRADNTRLRAEVDALERVKADIQRDSDLFRAIEQANIELREKASEAEAGRARAERALEEIDRRATEMETRLKALEDQRTELEASLVESRERAEEKRELIETLMVQVPDMEQQLATLERERLSLQSVLAERNNAIDALRVELDNREHRLAQAERVVQVMEQAREDVVRSNQRERRDMHYNMAAVYAREGRFRDAEAEYLRALELDPADADVHYNLGILYDDELANPEQAARHYRRYLRLRPHGEDADMVRHWLRRLEMAPTGR